jgi:indole-3-glycerol phosphate synthase
MSILQTIVAHKREEVAARKRLMPAAALEQSACFDTMGPSMAAALRNSSIGIIAEHKRRSPSRSVINNKTNLSEVVQGYKKAGASAISILTDTAFFGGSLDDLALASTTVSLPVLRKEFIIDPYQIIEAKAYGANAILLIAAVLTDHELKSFSQLAKQLNLDVLLEVHNHEELLRSLLPSVDMLGVNNRNLKTFEVSIEISKKLAAEIPSDFVKISESGINEVSAITELRDHGFQGFLIGEHFMKNDNPGQAASDFIKQIG